MNPPSRHRTPPFGQARPRAPVLLLWLLLINVLAVAALSVLALRAQASRIEEHRRVASQHALAALAARVENVLYQAVQAPFLLLRNVPPSSLTGDRLDRLRILDPHLRLLLVLNADFTQASGAPELPANEIQFLAAAVEEHVLGEELRGIRAHTTLRSFASADAGPRTLYAFVPLGDATELLGTTNTRDAGAGPWLLLGFDLNALEQSELRPLFAAFEREHGTRVALLPPDAYEQNSAVSISLARLLPGWRIDVVGAEPGRTGIIEVLGPASIAAALGLVLTIALVSVAIVRALGREHALVELRNRFVANVSHELKTPLSLIRMYAETLYLRRLDNRAREHEYHRVILTEAEKLSRMIGDVLSFARLREGLPVGRMDETDLGKTLRGIVSTYRQEWEGRGARIVTHIAGTLRPVAHDPQAITQLVLNLVDNAIKYGGPDCRVGIGLRDDGGRTRLEVIDHGAGIEPARRHRIGRAVRHGHVVEDAQGSGLGLSLVQQIANAHGARFALADAEGHSGLRAEVSFPHGHGDA